MKENSNDSNLEDVLYAYRTDKCPECGTALHRDVDSSQDETGEYFVKGYVSFCMSCGYQDEVYLSPKKN